MEPLAAAPVAAPALEMQALRIVPDEQIVALRFIADICRIMRRRPRDMGLAAAMEIRLVAFGAADRAMNNNMISLAFLNAPPRPRRFRRSGGLRRNG